MASKMLQLLSSWQEGIERLGCLGQWEELPSAALGVKHPYPRERLRWRGRTNLLPGGCVVSRIRYITSGHMLHLFCVACCMHRLLHTNLFDFGLGLRMKACWELQTVRYMWWC